MKRMSYFTEEDTISPVLTGASENVTIIGHKYCLFKNFKVTFIN